MKPNFFVIGAPKCGTTSLCELLSQHDDVFFSPEKEPRFFSHDGLYERGFDYYEHLFRDAGAQRRIGEGSTTYSEAWLGRDERSARRIHQYRPEAKIIYCVRHPLRRIESNWLDIIWSMDSGVMEGTELDRTGTLDISGDFNRDVATHPGLVATSNYWQRLQSYRAHFADEQIKMVFLEDFKEDSEAILRSCCTFLDIDPQFSFEEASKARNASAQKGLATGLGRIARQLPGYHALARNAPAFLRRMAQPFIKSRFKERPEWEEGTRENVLEELNDDLDTFLRFTGKPSGFWNL